MSRQVLQNDIIDRYIVHIFCTWTWTDHIDAIISSCRNGNIYCKDKLNVYEEKLRNKE